MRNQKVNKHTKVDAYPTKKMDLLLDKLRRARYICKMDMKQAFMQIPFEEKSRKYTAFAVSGSGLYQFSRLPVGLTNSLKTFSRLVDSLFGSEFEP